MKTMATYFQNDPLHPLVYGEAEIDNRPRKRLRGEPEKTGILCESVIVGFCGTDHELMRMGQAGKLSPKFPEGRERLINGHEGVVYVPSEKRFAIVLIRGGDSYDPTRFTEDESYFEYGCDGADGLFSDCGYYHPDMLLRIPNEAFSGGKLKLSAAKKLVFCDPFSCMLFQRERMEDLGEAHNFRVEMARNHCSEAEARAIARNSLFQRTVIFGLGTTGMFIGDLIREHHPDADILFVGRSPEDAPKVRFACEIAKAWYLSTDGMGEEEQARAIIEALSGKATVFIGVSGTAMEHRIAFTHGVLGCNGIYNSFSLGPEVSFDSMPFGFQNQLIFGSINFRQSHMEEAIRLLLRSRYDELVSLIDREEFTKDPVAAYEDRIYVKNAPMKTAVIWNPKYIAE